MKTQEVAYTFDGNVRFCAKLIDAITENVYWSSGFNSSPSTVKNSIYALIAAVPESVGGIQDFHIYVEDVLSNQGPQRITVEQLEAYISVEARGLR